MIKTWGIRFPKNPPCILTPVHQRWYLFSGPYSLSFCLNMRPVVPVFEATSFSTNWSLRVLLNLKSSTINQSFPTAVDTVRQGYGSGYA